MTIYIITFLVMAGTCAGLICYVGYKKYWEGRQGGWRACEHMAIERAKECGYDQNKFWSDILQ